MIADVSEAVDRHEAMILPDRKRPKFIHCFEDNAEKELLRLAARYPEGEFILFGAIKMAKRIPGTNEFKIEEWME